MPETKVPAIKNIPANIEPETKLALESIKEAVEVRLGRRGDPKDRAVTLRELIDSGLATDLAQSPYNPNTGATGFGPPSELPGDVEVPPVPINLRAETLFKDIALFWHTSRSFNPPYGNHASTEIWRSQTEDLSSAIAAGPLAGGVGGFSYTDTSTEYNRTYYYWVRYISTKGVPGPWSNMASATTVEDIGATMRLLSEELANLPGYNLITTTAAAATVIKQSSSPSVRADGSAIGAFDIWFDTDDSQVYTRNAANNAWVAGRDATLVNVFGATSFTGNTLTAAMASAQADVITVTNSQNATATAVTNLTSTVTGNNNTLTASVNSLSTTTANLNGDVNAMFVLTVATESNGSKSAAGMVIGSNANSGSGATSYVQFRADTFAIWNPSTTSTVAPFIITNNVVYIDTARIKDASITEAKIGTLSAEKITTGTLNVADLIDANAIDADKITAGTIGVRELGANFITANEINADTITANDLLSTNTLNVKHFDNVSTNIKSHLASGAYVPLSVEANVQSWSGTYPGQTIVSSETSSVVNIGCTTANVRNSAKYRVVVSGVYGDIRNGTIQYSYDNFSSIAATLSPTMNANAGTYRTYVFVWDGQIAGLSTSQSTVYWRINWNVSGGQVNSTYQALYVTLDNTQ